MRDKQKQAAMVLHSKKHVSPSVNDSSIEKVEIDRVTTHAEIEPALDRRITRLFDNRLVPWLFGLWLLAFIDRSNIGLAKINGLVTDLKLTGDKFNIVNWTLIYWASKYS